MPELRHLNALDYLIVVVYMILIAGVGLYVVRYNKRTADYFKGGGHIPWGLSAISLFVSGFSAFMFVGAAGFTYTNGAAALILFSLSFPAYILGYVLYGRLWRRTRIDTPMAFLTRRYSPGTTYFYTLLSVVPNVLVLGILIYSLCIFVSTALGFNQLAFNLGFVTINGFQLTLLITGLVLVFYTLLGGLWAVMVTDALQFLILFLVTLVMLPVAYIYLGDGNLTAGVSRLVESAPDGYFSLSLDDRPGLFWVAYFINIILGYNVNWHIAQRYYSVPDERDTKKMAAWCAGLGIALPLMWILPVMASRVLFPELESMWPELTEPSEAAFVTLALTVLPHGLIGFMVAAMFAATMSSADTTFNWMAAVLTKDVFVPVHRWLRGVVPSERLQLAIGKGSVAALGIIAIGVALSMEQFGGAFDVYLKVNSLYSPPMFIPVLLGLVITRTPWWSGMVAFGFGVVCIIMVSLLANLMQGLPVDSFGALFEDIEVNVLGMAMTRYELNTLVGVVASTACFFGSMPFTRRTGAFAERIMSLENDLQTPAYATGETLDLRGIQTYRLVGRLSVVIGGILLLMAFPTWQDGSASLNVIAGLLAIGLGVLIIWWIQRYAKDHSESSL